MKKGIRIKIGNKIYRLTGSKVFSFLLILGCALFSALPLVYVVSTSMKPLDELFLFPPRFLVNRPTLDNFNDLFQALDGQSVPFVKYVFNSLLVSLSVVLCTIFVSVLGAYGLVKHKVLGGKLIVSLIMAGLMVSTYVTRIPAYTIVSKLGFVNTHVALIIPNIAVAYNIFLMRQFMQQIPDQLLEAARIDGANEGRVLFHVVLPMLKPVVATLFVLSFVANWNEYFSAMIYIQNESLKTLPVVMQNLSSNNSIARAGASAAATFVTIIPTILVYAVMQSRVVDTMAHSGIKE